MMISRYRNYLEIVDTNLGELFEQQKSFIKCKKGCSYCCREGDYTVSELEYVNLMLFYNNLDNDTKGIINEKITDTLSKNRQKYYECPFLIDGACAVYPARPIICRIFGLITNENGKRKIPFCVDLGLNYSDVFDKNNSEIIKCAPDGTKPCAFNVDRRFIRRREIEETFNIFFGEDKSLIDWLKEDF